MPKKKRKSRSIKKPVRSDRRTQGPSVFLCHSSKDKDFVRRLASDLSLLQVSPWFDEWALAPGDSLHDVIGRAITDTAYVVIVISPDSINSVWCQSELNSALSYELRLGRTFVLPLIYRKTKLPAFLLDKSYLDFTDNYFSNLARLAGTILGLNQRVLAQTLSSKACKDLPAVIRALSRSGNQGLISLPGILVSELRTILDEHGYELGSEFGIITDLKRRGGGGPIAPC